MPGLKIAMEKQQAGMTVLKQLSLPASRQACREGAKSRLYFFMNFSVCVTSPHVAVNR